jgi:hypothetical protein
MTKPETHQIKSSRYYLFWGIATVAVTLGQVYVGLGYRRMAHNVGVLTLTLTNALNTELEYRPLEDITASKK